MKWIKSSEYTMKDLYYEIPLSFLDNIIILNEFKEFKRELKILRENKYKISTPLYKFCRTLINGKYEHLDYFSLEFFNSKNGCTRNIFITKELYKILVNHNIIIKSSNNNSDTNIPTHNSQVVDNISINKKLLFKKETEVNILITKAMDI